ncbi:MAG: hypothetical protein HFG49_16575, partial [Lachnospiraceae bacterium]|nr:hypothetical protein [Lachnospiraceae bacterium]
MTKQEFIKMIVPLAQEEQKETGILASVTIAQACLESGYGTSELAVNANNLFGMKCMLSGNTWESVWDGVANYEKETQEQGKGGNVYSIIAPPLLQSGWRSAPKGGNVYSIIAQFRKYPDIAASIRDHSLYLLQAMNGEQSRYAGLA